MSVRQEIVTAVVNSLGTIKKVNGYETDCGAKVKEWEKFSDPVKDAETLHVRDAACSPRDPDEEDDNTEEQHYKGLKLNIIVLRSGGDTASELRTAVSDIYKAIKNIIRPGAVNRIEWNGDETDVDDLNKKYGGTMITITVNYTVPAWAD